MRNRGLCCCLLRHNAILVLFVRQMHPWLNSLSFASSSLVNHLKFYFIPPSSSGQTGIQSPLLFLRLFAIFIGSACLCIACGFVLCSGLAQPAHRAVGRCVSPPPQQVHSTPSMMRLLADAPAKGWRVVGATLSPQAVTLPQLPTGVPAGGVVWVFIVFAG